MKKESFIGQSHYQHEKNLELPLSADDSGGNLSDQDADMISIPIPNKASLRAKNTLQ